MPVLLLDRDGVINENCEARVACWEDFRFLPGSVEAMAELRAAGLRLAITTNQSAVGRGLMTAASLDAIHRRMETYCRANGAAIDAVLACCHAPTDGCSCRKPKPGLLRRAMAMFGERPEACLAIGDGWEDLLAARAARVAFGLVLTGRGEQALLHPAARAHPPLFIAHDLRDAVEEIKRRLTRVQERRAA